VTLPPFFSSLRVRLLALVLLALCPAIALMHYSGWQTRRADAAAVRERAQLLVRMAAAGEESVLEGTHQLLVTLAESDEVRLGSPQGCTRLFSLLLQQNRRYAGLTVTRADGSIVCSEPRVDGRVNFADRSWFNRAVATRDFAVGEYQVGRLTGRPVLVAAVPIVNESGRVQGVVSSALDLAWLNSLAGDAQLPPGSTATMIDRNGAILARYPRHDDWIGRRAPAELLQAMRAAENGVAEVTGLDGVQRVTAFTSVRAPGEAGLRLSVGIPREVAYAEAFAAQRRIVIAALVVVVLTLTAAWVGADLFMLRLARALVAATNRLAGGDMAVRSGLSHTRGELGDLARAFDALAAALETRQAERIRTEEALRESDRALSTLMGNLPGMVYRCRYDAEWTMEFVSQGCRELTGYEPADLLGNRTISYGSLVHPDDHQKGLDQIDAAVRARLPFRLMYRIRTAGGRTKWVWEQGVGVPSPDSEVRYLEGFITDITDRTNAEEALRESEEQLRQAQKMEAIGRLAGGIAHDFNNLLTAILGYSDLLLARLRPGNPLSGEVEEIKRAGERGASLVRQLLAFSRKQVLAPHVLELGRVVVGMERILRRLIGEDIALDILTADTGCVKADPVQIEQVIINLAINARDAMPLGGRLTIETRDVELEQGDARVRAGLGPGRHVLLRITDSGTGMDAETRSHLFEPFFTTKDVGKGTGLGLSTVYGIVRQSGGHIEMDSEPGRGTVVEVYLPAVADLVEAPTESPKTLEARPGVETVLFVEDEETLRQLVRTGLERHGYTVLEAANGEEAVAICQRYPGRIDLVVSDVVMPQLGGVAIVQRLALLRPDARVLLLSGYTDAAARHGVVDLQTPFLHKPFTLAALLHKVREVLDATSSKDGESRTEN
jgi:two-component system cell cycle sensor histidine kinase/response regulator CckA